MNPPRIRFYGRQTSVCSLQTAMRPPCESRRALQHVHWTLCPLPCTGCLPIYRLTPRQAGFTWRGRGRIIVLVCTTKGRPVGRPSLTLMLAGAVRASTIPERALPGCSLRTVALVAGGVRARAGHNSSRVGDRERVFVRRRRGY